MDNHLGAGEPSRIHDDRVRLGKFCGIPSPTCVSGVSTEAANPFVEMRTVAALLPVTTPVARIEDVTAVPLPAHHLSVDDVEVARRLLSLISLLGIYVLGLLLVALISEGPDIGVLLAAMFCHAIYVSVRWTVREQRRRTIVLTAVRRGVVVLGARPRLIAYRDIGDATASDEGLILKLRRGERVEVRWDMATERDRRAFLRRLYGRVRLAGQRREVNRSQESLARLTAALESLAKSGSSTHLAATG